VRVGFAGISSPLTDSNRRPPPYHSASMRHARVRAGHDVHESPGNRRIRRRTSDREWTRMPALVFPQCSLGEEFAMTMQDESLESFADLFMERFPPMVTAQAMLASASTSCGSGSSRSGETRTRRRTAACACRRSICSRSSGSEAARPAVTRVSRRGARSCRRRGVRAGRRSLAGPRARRLRARSGRPGVRRP
jgi:hypothetical protein